MKLPIPKDEHEERAISNIERTGLHILNVFSDDETSEFSYSVGLTYSYGQPEVLIYGLNRDVATDILNQVASLMETGTKFRDKDISLDVLDGFECKFMKVHKSHYRNHVGWTIWLNDYSNDFELLQLVWPDKAGSFPDSNDASDDFKAAQPLLNEAAVS